MLFGLKDKPEYFFRPWQIYRRLYRSVFWPKKGEICLTLPWGLQLIVNTEDAIGRAIIKTGLYDLVVAEALWRLCPLGGTVCDVGAHIGYTGSILAKRIGTKGKVHLFEPNPRLLKLLRNNVELWEGIKSVCEIHPFALSSQNREATLVLPQGYNENQGLGYLSSESKVTGEKISVETQTLEACPDLNNITIDLMKVDVEGHELEVFKGAEKLLREGRIRHILFEELEVPPTPTTDYLISKGYKIIKIEKQFMSPKITEEINTPRKIDWEPLSLLATKDFDSVKNIFSEWGWKCLRS